MIQFRNGLLLLLLLLLGLVVAISATNSSTIVTSLPGYTGDLPFTLETGYIGVGDNETVQTFYYFIESQRSPTRDPLMLWMTGGPGCSSIAGFMFESGPITFTLGDYNGSLPTLKDNPWAWTQSLNIIYMDGPVGAGFSYSESLDAYYSDDYEFAAQTHEFLRKWLELHPQFLENQIYIGGDSYSGIPIPIIMQNIVIANEAGNLPLINIRGYVLGNPVTDGYTDVNARITYAHRLSLISDALYESAKNSCDSNYVNIDPINYQCVSDVAAIDALTSDINLVQILEPYCSNAVPEPNEDVESVRRFLTKVSSPTTVSSPTATHWCRSYNHMLCYVWANEKSVQEALGIRPGTKHFWQYCNTTLAYTKSVTNVVSYHRNLTNADMRLLVYSGDHDMSIPHIGTQQWISSLGLTTDESWRVWSVNGQTAGYTKKLIDTTFTLNYVTVKGAGHFAAEYMVKECAAMIDRWLAYFPI